MQSLAISTQRLAVICFISMLVFSCSKDAENPVDLDGSFSKTKVKTVLDIDQVSGVTDQLVNEIFQAGDTAKNLQLPDCYQADYTDTGFKVTFENCSVEGSENLNGTISAVYEIGMNISNVVVTYTNLMVGDIAINGTRTFSFSTESTESVTFSITSDLVITLGDGAVIKEKGNKVVGIVFDGSFENGAITLDGQWTVEADGDTYVVKITSLLETPFNCEYVAKGIMTLAKNGLQVSVDFGDGTCDDMAALAYPDGTKEDYSLND